MSLKQEEKNLMIHWHQYGMTPALQAEWLRTWQTYIEYEKGHALPLSQVSSLAYLGYTISMHMSDYIGAAKVWTAYFEHPNLETDNIENRAYNTCHLATSHLWLGEMIEALREYQLALLMVPIAEQKSIALFILECVRNYCFDQAENVVAEQILISFVCEMKGKVLNLPMVATDDIPRTFGDLVEISLIYD